MGASENKCKKSRVKTRGKHSKGQRKSSIKTSGIKHTFADLSKNVKVGWTPRERANAFVPLLLKSGE